MTDEVKLLEESCANTKAVQKILEIIQYENPNIVMRSSNELVKMVLARYPVFNDSPSCQLVETLTKKIGKYSDGFTTYEVISDGETFVITCTEGIILVGVGITKEE